MTSRAKQWPRPEPPSRILAIRLQALGDTVLTLPYLRALQRLLPGVSLDFLTRSEVAEIPRAVVLFDDVFEIGGGRNPRRQLISALSLVPRLRRRRYDVVLDLQRNRISRLVRLLLNPTAWSEFDRFSPLLAGERTRRTIEAAGLGPLEVYPDLAVRREDRGLESLRRAGWDGTSQYVVVNPAGAFPGRAWPIESYARFAELWLARVAPGTRFAVLGLPTLAAKARILERRLGDRMLDLVGRTSASEAFAVVGQADLVLSEDSGLMHMAWVAGVPTLALFGASRSIWSRPHGTHSDCIQACRRPDGSCIEGRCRNGPPTCLDRLSVETVLDRAQALVRRAAEYPAIIHSEPRAPERRSSELDG